MLLEAVLLVALGISWDAWNRYLKYRERTAQLQSDRQDRLVKELVEVTEVVGASIEKNRATLKGFLDSMTDIVKLSEADKQALQNRIVASKLEKR